MLAMAFLTGYVTASASKNVPAPLISLDSEQQIG